MDPDSRFWVFSSWCSNASFRSAPNIGTSSLDGSKTGPGYQFFRFSYHAPPILRPRYPPITDAAHHLYHQTPYTTPCPQKGLGIMEASERSWRYQAIILRVGCAVGCFTDVNGCFFAASCITEHLGNVPNFHAIYNPPNAFDTSDVRLQR
ncbi:hypothetical protein M011DRAFT_467385 [Sporormia fimetaria CBS 119925]|uniref:Uncharacterized protein n=1 Tax=Sporormia fimetaria CBS 119925 TaxID=1340428 RepID=A0A6A6VCC3_9PLEO|nr:hypothetical protein M011DRAFT_467385 [Sporormia fimetaria CBS 119925]